MPAPDETPIDMYLDIHGTFPEEEIVSHGSNSFVNALWAPVFAPLKVWDEVKENYRELQAESKEAAKAQEAERQRLSRLGLQEVTTTSVLAALFNRIVFVFFLLSPILIPLLIVWKVIDWVWRAVVD
jgi:ABC-type transport system involved in Fe-S cluster assembly fused permease/ATPase subunit